MGNEKDILMKLHEHLGFSRAQNIQKRIIDRKGKTFSISYINLVLNPKNKRFNPIIFNEAVLYAKKLKTDARKNRVKQLKEIKSLSKQGRATL